MMKSKYKLFKVLIATTIVSCLYGALTPAFAVGLPGEYYISQRWRDLFAGISPTGNPSFITEANYPSVRGALCPTLEGAFILAEMGYIHPIMLYHSVGFSYVGLSARDPITGNTINSEGNIIPDGNVYKDNHNTYVFSYAVNPWNRLSLGVNANIYQHSNFKSPINGFSMDVGLSYRVVHHPLLGDHLFGASILNLISPNVRELTKINKNSANFKASWYAKVWEKRVDAGLDINVKDFLAQSDEFIAGKKIEYDYNARVGLWILRMFNAYIHYGGTNPNYWGITGGANIPTVNNGRDAQVAYQYMSILDGNPFTATHTVYGRFDVGEHREEVYARRMARLASVGPGDLYNRARNFFAQGKYWDAFYLFGKIFVEYPDFFKNDYVRLFMGQCQEEMDMREFSIENYNETKKLFPRSVVVPLADLGIMRIHYRDFNASGVANQFARLNTSTTPDSIKYHAYYYMGQQHVRDGDYEKAKQLFTLIPDNHPEYVFAQHSLAVSYSLSNNIDNAIQALDNVIQYKPKNKEQGEVINRSFVFLGYIFYEGLGGQERALSKAVSALRRVDKGSYYYEDALLGLAWTALRASQWADCVSACDELDLVTDKLVNKCEAALLKGYCFLVDKRYADAVNVFRPASEKIANLKPPSEQEKSSAKSVYDDNRGSYYEMAAKANELALTSQSTFVLQQIDSLRSPQAEFQKKIVNYAKFNDEFARRSFFSRNIDAVRQDLEYAQATAEKMVGQKDIQKETQKVQQKASEIDKEMEKLQEQLKKMDQKDTTKN